MKILPILSNNYNCSNKKKNLPASTLKPSISNNQLSFGSLGFLEGIKKFNPFKVEIIETTEQAIQHLKNKNSGLYIFNGEKYIKNPFENYSNIKAGSVNKLVMKSPVIQREDFLISPDTIDFIIKPFKYRKGIYPQMMLNFLNKGVEEVVLLADNGIQKLHLPTDEVARKNAISIFENSKEYKSDIAGEVDFIAYNQKSEFLYDLTKAMIKNANIDGVSLEVAKIQ